MSAATASQQHQMDNTTAHTYAQVAKPPSINTLTAPTIEELRQRTFTFYNLNTAADLTKTIIKSLIDKFNVPAKELIQKIYQDTRFRSRYVVTFYKQSQFDTLLNEGITINGTVIRGKADKPTRYYLPNFPGFCSSAEVRQALFEKGIHNVGYIKQRMDKEFGIPVGGWFLGIFNSTTDDFFIDFEGDSFKCTCIERRHVQPDFDVAQHQNNNSADQNGSAPDQKENDDTKEDANKPDDASMESDESETSTVENIETPNVITTSTKFDFSMDPSFVIGYISTDDETLNSKGKRTRKKKPITIATEKTLTKKQRAKMKQKLIKQVEKATKDRKSNKAAQN